MDGGGGKRFKLAEEGEEEEGSGMDVAEGQSRGGGDLWHRRLEQILALDDEEMNDGDDAPVVKKGGTDGGKAVGGSGDKAVGGSGEKQSEGKKPVNDQGRMFPFAPDEEVANGLSIDGYLAEKENFEGYSVDSLGQLGEDNMGNYWGRFKIIKTVPVNGDNYMELYYGVPWLQLSNLNKYVDFTGERTYILRGFGSWEKRELYLIKAYLDNVKDELKKQVQTDFEDRFVFDEKRAYRNVVMMNDLMTMFLYLYKTLNPEGKTKLYEFIYDTGVKAEKSIHPHYPRPKPVYGSIVYMIRAMEPLEVEGVKLESGGEGEEEKQADSNSGVKETGSGQRGGKMVEAFLKSAIDLLDYETRVGLLKQDGIAHITYEYENQVRDVIRALQEDLGSVSLTVNNTVDVKTPGYMMQAFKLAQRTIGIKKAGEEASVDVTEGLADSFQKIIQNEKALIARVETWTETALRQNGRMLATVRELQRKNRELTKELTELKRKGVRATTTTTSAIQIPLSAKLAPAVRSVLMMRVMSFLTKGSRFMSFVVSVLGFRQAKDVTTVIQVNVVTILMDAICEIKKEGDDISTMPITQEMFKEGPSGSSAERLLASLFRNETVDQLEDLAEQFLSPPSLAGFKSVMTYVKSLYKESRSRPLELNVLVMNKEKGILDDIARMVAAGLTDSQALHKQISSTHYDQMPLSRAYAEAKLMIRVKMMRLGFNYYGVDPRNYL